MKYTVKKTGRTFESPQSYINHIRKIYPDMLTAYLEENDIEHPKCPICNVRFLAFKSVFRGFFQSCNHPECKYIICTEANRKIASKKTAGIPGYDEYINNHRVEIDACINENKPFYDEVTDRLHKNRYFLTMYSPSKLSSSIFNVTRQCIVCGDSFESQFWDHQKMCSKRCKRRFANHAAQARRYNLRTVSVKEQTEMTFLQYSQGVVDGKIKVAHKGIKTGEPYKVILLKTLRNANHVFMCHELGHLCALKPSRVHGVLTNHTAQVLHAHQLLSPEILQKFYPTKVCCSVCNAHITPSMLFKVESSTLQKIEDIPTSRYFYCSRNCYFTALKSGKSLLYEYTDEMKKRQSRQLVERIQRGEFTPKSNNRRTHLFSVGEKQYRSSWEFVFECYYTKLQDNNLEYETIRIPYIENGKPRTYIVDYYDSVNKILFEIKPKELIQQCLVKIKAAEQYAREHGLKFTIITQDFFSKLTLNEKESILNIVTSNISDEKLIMRCKKILC